MLLNVVDRADVKTPPRNYFAFPIGTRLTPEERLRVLQSAINHSEPSSAKPNAILDDADAKQRELDEAWAKRVQEDEELRRKREEREREQALIGEMDWVRSGGVLRDENGKRDYARTAEIRKLVEEEDKQKRAMERWIAYESSWTRLLTTTDPVTFASIPWPLLHKPSSSEDLRDPVKIAEFLFESLKVKGIAVKRKDRLRASLLRWHPDKLGGVIARATEEEAEEVKEGISAVARGLMVLQEACKSDRS
jgi:hypothetical protein